MNKKYLNTDEASEIITQLGMEFAAVNNPDDVFPAFEICPMVPKITSRIKNLSAIVMNMEGVFLSTESLKMQALEYMVRQISGRFEKEDWRGLDKIIDYPNILGQNSVNPVEFLIQRYHNFIKPEFFKEAYFRSALWTLILGHDGSRKKAVRQNLVNLGCGDMLNDPKLEEYIVLKEFGKYNSNVITSYFMHKYNPAINLQNFAITAGAAYDIYFKRYYEMLEYIKLGEGHNLAKETIDGEVQEFVEPASELAGFLCLVKGLLGEDVGLLFDAANETLKHKDSQSYNISDVTSVRDNLVRLGKKFQDNPVKFGLVSTEGHYETSIVINEAFNILSAQIRTWKLPEEKRNLLIEKFSDYHNIIDSLVTSNDISRLRTKPYRDQYSLSLNQLGISKNRFSEVLGIEDTENGIISLRASGIGLCVAIPHSRIASQTLSSAAYYTPGGIPEILLTHNCFVL